MGKQHIEATIPMLGKEDARQVRRRMLLDTGESSGVGSVPSSAATMLDSESS